MIAAPAVTFKFYSVVSDYPRLPDLLITQEQVDDAYGPEDSGHSIMFSLDSEWARLRACFFQQRIVHVRRNNVLLLRFKYNYEVELDRIHTERDLLAWVLQLVGKPWMNAERVKVFAEVVTDLKGFDIRLP